MIRVFKLSRKEDGALTKVTSSFDFPEVGGVDGEKGMGRGVE